MEKNFKFLSQEKSVHVFSLKYLHICITIFLYHLENIEIRLAITILEIFILFKNDIFFKYLSYYSTIILICESIHKVDQVRIRNYLQV